MSHLLHFIYDSLDLYTQKCMISYLIKVCGFFANVAIAWYEMCCFFTKCKASKCVCDRLSNRNIDENVAFIAIHHKIPTFFPLLIPKFLYVINKIENIKTSKPFVGMHFEQYVYQSNNVAIVLNVKRLSLIKRISKIERHRAH